MAEEEVKKEAVDAESTPRQEEDVKTSTERGEDTASTGENAGAKASEERGEDAVSTGENAGAKASEERGEDTASTEKPAKPAEPDWKDQYARLLADFDNFKKRTARDREDTYRYAEGDILKDILPTVDNLGLALSKAEDKENAFVKGVQLVYDNLLKALKDHDAEPFDCVGKELDTERMEAIAHLPSPDVEEGKVSIESKKGWLLKGKVLRAAQVVVSAGAPQ